jgi:hypothetical protein
MSRTIRLTERDLSRIVKRVINEEVLNLNQGHTMKQSINVPTIFSNLGPRLGETGTFQIVNNTIVLTGKDGATLTFVGTINQ